MQLQQKWVVQVLHSPLLMFFVKINKIIQQSTDADAILNGFFLHPLLG